MSSNAALGVPSQEPVVGRATVRIRVLVRSTGSAFAEEYCSILPDVMCRSARPYARSKTVGSVLA